MTSIERLEHYLGQFRDRLIRLTRWRGLAAMSIAAIVITLVTVTLAIRTGFPADLMITARVLLLATLVVLFVVAIRLPGKRIETDASTDVERRAPEFAGRVETYVGLQDADNPMRDLLAEDALKIAQRHPPESTIRRKEFSLAWGVAGLCLGALLILAIAGPGNYAYGVRHLWVGWAFPGVLPPQSIAVIPGDDGIRSGGTVRVRATMQGFSPQDAWVNARFGDDDWQRVSMADIDSGFEFTFFSVREPLEYYVSAANVRSPSFRINVVDLPSIDRLTTTYNFPEWTRLEPETRDPGGDIRTIAETDVDIEIHSPDALTPGVLVVDDEEIPLAIDGSTGTASFTVNEDGQYYIAAVVGGERIRLTDDYFISVQDDAAPSIEFARPGRDWSASSIEEVTTQIIATDDFLVESLELRYSVNGGDWQSVPLAAGEQETDASHVFFLESLMQEQDPTSELVPGDLISYYALANDRESSARTDIFFVDVQPFDRRYSQSQMSGGGGGGGGQQQDEISQRQREIIVSTWNLIREAQENRRGDDTYVPNNAALLSRLQGTLKEQAETLAERTRARQLAASDEKIAEFVENLDRAAAAMVPAAERLAEIDLEEAILPEQEALQHLLRAEAVFTDISVSMQANNRGGGGGGRAGRDLTDMFELEMDLEKNQYETGSQATPEPPQQQLDEIGNELEELARRQEQLANRMQRERTPTPAERWQQDLLRREVEELRDRLEQMQQAANAQQEQQGQSSGQSGQGQSQSGEQPDAGSNALQDSQARANEEQRRQSEQLQRRLDSAVRAMSEAEEAMRQGSDRDTLQRAAAEAQRQLEGARDQASAESERLTQESLAALGERADGLYDRQADIEQRLQEAIRDILEQSDNDDRLDSGMTFQEEYAMAQEKRRLQSDLQGLEQDVKSTAQSLSDSQPESSEELEDALRRLREDEVDARLAISAAYIEQGEAVYVSGSESAITESLREFGEALQRAGQAATNRQGNPAGDGEQRGIEQTLADTQALRRQLQRLANEANQQRPEGNAGDPNQESNPTANPSGQPFSTGRDDRQRSTGVRVADLEFSRELSRDFERVSDDVLNLFRDLRAAGVSEQNIDNLRQLAREVRASDFSGNEAILARESQLALNLVEQLELALAQASRAERDTVRSNPIDPVPDEHRKPVANYYRKLGEDNSTDQE
jgi:hypothetical protein